MGGWAVAKSPILGTTIAMDRPAKRGYESMFSYYEKVSPQFNEPLYTRPPGCPEKSKGTVVMPTQELRQINVRGATHQLTLVARLLDWQLPCFS
jgi:hypothetical protein